MGVTDVNSQSEGPQQNPFVLFFLSDCPRVCCHKLGKQSILLGLASSQVFRVILVYFCPHQLESCVAVGPRGFQYLATRKIQAPPSYGSGRYGLGSKPIFGKGMRRSTFQ